MAQKGLTKKQFRIQMVIVVFWELYAVEMLVAGILERSTFRWILGAVLGFLYIGYTIYLIDQRKRYPVEDAQLDKQLGENFKTGMTGMGIVVALITAGFLIAFGLAALFK